MWIYGSGGYAVKKIAIFQKDFQVGGIQRSLLSILEKLDYSKYSVDLYYFDDKPFFELPKRDKLNYIYCRPFPYYYRFLYFGLIRKLAHFPFSGREYDLAVDFNSYSGECAAGALAVKADRRVEWIHNDMQIKHASEPKYRVLWHFFKSKFKAFDEFCAVSPGIIDGFRKMTGLADAKVTVVQNYIDTDAIFKKAEEDTDFRPREEEYNLCTMGRLCHQKGFDILLDIMGDVVSRRQDMHLYIIGDGPDRDKLEKQIRAGGLESHVTMLGNRQNPFPILRHMDGFALTSRYEGQGMVLWEAKSLGLELFAAKNLERYNPGISGRDDMLSALVGAEKREKTRDDLREYNDGISRALDGVFDRESR